MISKKGIVISGGINGTQVKSKLDLTELHFFGEIRNHPYFPIHKSFPPVNEGIHRFLEGTGQYHGSTRAVPREYQRELHTVPKESCRGFS